MALKVTQINLNHCVVAQDLLFQTMREEKVDGFIVADQYMKLDELSWKTDPTSSHGSLEGKSFRPKMTTKTVGGIAFLHI